MNRENAHLLAIHYALIVLVVLAESISEYPTQVHKEMVVEAGGNVSLRCDTNSDISGDKLADVSWYMEFLDGTEEFVATQHNCRYGCKHDSSSDRFNVELDIEKKTATLKITNVQQSDMGIYVCFFVMESGIEKDVAALRIKPDTDRLESAKQRSRTAKDTSDGGLTADDALPPQVAASRRMARPSSARPAPPRLKKQDSVDDNSRVGTGKQVSNVIVDNAHNSDDEDDIFVVEDTQPVVEDEARPSASESLEDDGEHGGLVKKILETKKELEGSQNKQDDKPVALDPARRKERELVQREVEKLRGTIQTLTRSANPLGKIMDYLQEDVDSMQKELEMWQRENKKVFLE